MLQTLRLKGDIKVGWGNYANVQNEARRLLFSVADQEVIDEACENVLDDELGYMLPKFQLQFNVANLTRLPLPRLCYVACASVLYGGCRRRRFNQNPFT